MKVFNALLAGLASTFRVWKAVLIMWFFSILLVSMLAIPLKGSLMSVFGKSMITEIFSEGLNIEILPDMGSSLNTIISSFSSGFFFMIMAGFLMNVFLSGGLFGSIRDGSVRFSSSSFFRSAAYYFRSFLVIMLIISVIMIFLILLVMIVPIVIVSTSDSVTEKGFFNTLIISGAVTCIFILMLLLVADFARAWQISNVPAGFRALAFGFRQSFRYFLSSFFFMLILIIVQVLFTFSVFKFLSTWRPINGGGIFLLFLVSQFLFFIKIMLRTWRYAGVTDLMDQSFKNQNINPII